MPEKLNRVMVFGSAARSCDDGTFYLSHVGIARAEKTLEHFFSGEFDARSNESYVLLAGGYGRQLALDGTVPDYAHRESRLMADYLVRHGVPAGKLLLEDESTNTIENWHYSMTRYGEVVAPEVFTKQEPLALVSHPNHLKRARYVGELLGFRAAHMALLPTPQQDCAAAESEAMSRVLARYRAYFARAAA